MRVIVLTSRGREVAARVAAESIERWHPGAEIELVDLGPRAEVGMVGELRHSDVHVGLGPAWARWAALPSVLTSRLDDELVVLPDSVWLIGSDLSEAEGTTFVARHGDARTGITYGGLVPELLRVGPSSGEVLGWWAAQAVAVIGESGHDAGVDPWAEFASGGEGVTISSSGAFRLGPWLAHDADVVRLGGDQVALDGSPVSIVHFPGFDPTEPFWWPNGDRRGTLLSRAPAVRPIVHAYAEALISHGWGSELDVTASEVEQAFERPAVRTCFREELSGALHGSGTRPPNPFVAGEEDAALDWLLAPGPITGVSRIADAVWEERPDLHAVFPSVRHRHRGDFIGWLLEYGVSEAVIPRSMLPDRPIASTIAPGRFGEPSRPRSRRRRRGGVVDTGVNLIGYHRADLGLGVAVRRVASALEAADIAYTAIDYDRTDSRRRDAVPNEAGPVHDLNLVLITPDQLGWFANDVGTELLSGRYSIGLWYWETDVLPDRVTAAFDLVDEVWGATNYLRDVFAAHTRKPVQRVPIPLSFGEPDVTPGTRERLGLDERFTVLFSFDFLSTMRRKNPTGLVEAYRRAFPRDDGSTRLILKSINGGLREREVELLLDLAADRSDIELWDRYLSAEDRLSLVAHADCFVSLHRSEGLGLTMAEAMWTGTPVIATGYSGNLDFMPPGAALLVDPIAHIEVGPGLPYPAEGRWADPNLDQAAAHMRAVRADPQLRSQLSDAGRTAVRRFSPEAVGAHMRARLDEIRAAR